MIPRRPTIWQKQVEEDYKYIKNQATILDRIRSLIVLHGT